jgi:quinoprotein relay system zinc metallohydrolase 1
LNGSFVPALLLCAATAYAPSASAAHDYHLKPVQVAPGVYEFIGANENFTRTNGGNIANTGFIVGPRGVVVIDTGPSRLYGEQQRAAIAQVTALPVVQVYNTHAHPDHFLGNQAYPATIIAASSRAVTAINANGNALSDNLYRMVGGAMVGTEVRAPGLSVTTSTASAGGVALRLIAAQGHTDGDLMILDEHTKTLFTGDLVFYQRAPTTPNAQVRVWLQTLRQIEEMDLKVMVPGHGPSVSDAAAVLQTRDYLQWLQNSLRDAAIRGLDMPEVMRMPLPARFASLAVIDTEYPRSVAHRQPAGVAAGQPSRPALSGLRTRSCRR